MNSFIHGDHELEVGKVYFDKEVRDATEVYYRVAFRVIRVATEQEFIDFIKSKYPDYEFGRNGKYFYEVQMD